MPTTFNLLYLGTGTLIDPTEGNTTAENASALVGITYGSAGSPLYLTRTQATFTSLGGSTANLDMNNSATNDTITTDIGAGVQTFVYDGTTTYNATITYVDNTTATVTAVVVQTTSGHLFLAPEVAANADTTAYELRPIRSFRIDSINTNTLTGTGINRQATAWDDGVVNGTAAADLINGTYVEPIALGSDRVDNADGLNANRNDDLIRAEAGNDTVLSGAGNDSVFGGTGRDSINGGADDDSLLGEDDGDTLIGGDGNDQLFGGNGEDSLQGEGGNDVLTGESGQDTLEGGSGADQLFGGDGNDTLFGGAGDDQIRGDGGNDLIVLDGGADSVNGGADRDTVVMTLTGGVTSVVDGGDTGDDFDVLDLTAWGKDNTVVFRDPGDPENGHVDFFDNSGVFLGRMTFTDVERVIPCFTPGTLIAAVRGLIRVEDLRPGDLVQTRDHGMQPLRWIGRRNLTVADLVVRPDLCPVRIAAGALGQGTPCRDLILSPQHRVLVSSRAAEMLFGEYEVLVAARHLVGRPGITRQQPRRVGYLHLLFDWHEIVLSEGAWTESFQPADRNLAQMADATRHEILTLFPDLQVEGGFPSARMTLRGHEARVLLSAGAV